MNKYPMVGKDYQKGAFGVTFQLHSKMRLDYAKFRFEMTKLVNTVNPGLMRSVNAVDVQEGKYRDSWSNTGRVYRVSLLVTEDCDVTETIRAFTEAAQEVASKVEKARRMVEMAGMIDED